MSASSFESVLQNNDVWRSTLLPLLDPIDLIRLVHVSRASRRAAARALNALEAGASHQTGMFRAFLRNPRVAQPNHSPCISDYDCSRANRLLWLVDPKRPALRLGVIADLAADIEKRFAILRFERSYDKERSLVVLFDERGAFLGHYEFASAQFYEDYATSNTVLEGGGGVRALAFPKMQLLSSGCGWAAAANDRKWREPADFPARYNTEFGINCGTWEGDVLGPHVALIEAFAGKLYPAEAMFVLMHALSSDTRVIYVMVVNFHEYFHDAFWRDNITGFIPADIELRRELKQRLDQISYPAEEGAEGGHN